MDDMTLCAETFLAEQGKMFSEPVATTLEEAIEFLEDSMAQVFNSVEEIREFWEEEGMDATGMSDEEIKESLEVFELSDGRFMVLE